MGTKLIDKEKKNKPRIYTRLYSKIYNSQLGVLFRNLTSWIFKKIEESIRFELMFVFSLCFIVSFTFYSMIKDNFDKVYTDTRIRYDYGDVRYNAEKIVEKLKNNKDHITDGDDKLVNSIDDKEKINKILNEVDANNSKIYLTDMDGKVLYSVNATEEKLDIYSVLDKNNLESDNEYEGGERVLIYPLKIGDERVYLIYSKIPTPYIDETSYTDENPFIALLLSVLLFIIVFIVITDRKMKYLDEIAKGVKIISAGDLSHRINEKGKDEIKNLAENINIMASEIESGIEKEREAEKMKSELITNVSHDLRTPLTSIMGYIGLVKDGKYENESMKREYLDIAFNKSNQLKELIEDLFEYTKLNKASIKLEKTDVNIVEFLSQIIEEYVPIFEDNDLEVVKRFIDENCIVNIDASKIARVFENLFSNAIKYSYKPGEIVVSCYENKGYVNIVIRNKGENISKEKINKLFDRFYRGDEARNSSVKGSGLGLAITKNIVDMHDGVIWAECVENDISFFVKLKCIK